MNFRPTRWIFLIVSIAILTVNVHAGSFSASEIQDLKKATATFDGAMRKLDMKSVLKFMPPKVWNFIRDRAKTTDEQLLESISKVMTKTFETVTLIDFKMDVENSTTQELSDGSLIQFIPTQTKMELDDHRKLLSTSETLAILEDGKWYLMRVSEQRQQSILIKIYPAFANVKFPEDKMEELKE
jgi:hypothetical protein